MKKIIFFILAVFLVNPALPTGAAISPVEEGVSGHLLNLQKDPPKIKIFTGGGDKTFSWSLEETEFTDLKGEKIEPSSFLSVYRNKGVTLIFHDKRLVHVFASLF